MFKKIAVVLVACLVVVACSSEAPRVVQASADMPEVRLVAGMATQIEMPPAKRVLSVTVGNPALVTAERSADVVNLIAKAGAGETNLIIRAIDDDDRTQVYHYRLIIVER